MDFEIGYTGEKEKKKKKREKTTTTPSDGKIKCLLNKIILAKLRQILALFPSYSAYLSISISFSIYIDIDI